MASNKSMFIAIEGGDGSGKATQAKLLADKLRREKYDVLEISFPRYGKPSAFYTERYLNGDYGAADKIPADLGSLPYMIDRYAAKNDILDHLKKPNSIVISDRYVASNLAHQGTKLSDQSQRIEFYERVKSTEYDIFSIPKPDLNIVLAVTPQHMQANVDKKSARSYTDRKRDVHEADVDHLEKAKQNYE